MIDRFADTPQPPYVAVVFSSQLNGNGEGYDEMAAKMFQIAVGQPGCLGAETARGADGFGITVAYFKNEDAVRAWKEDVGHLAAQRLGKERWYSHYRVRVARVERAYAGP
jgi:heme-degrading monooxygenase HmoA